MLDFRMIVGDDGRQVVDVPLAGIPLLDTPIFNKGSAFGAQERDAFGLRGLLPPHVGSLEEQLDRRYRDFQSKRSDLQQHIYLRDLQDRNEVLFYRLLRDHISEMLPLIYTPTVGDACEHFSRIYRRPRGLFVSFEDRGRIADVLANRPFRDVEVIVVTDGERILGLGDLGVGGMGIPVGKLSLYTLCGGIHPSRTLPILLDVGTNNPDSLADPLYLGWRHERLRGAEYDDFVEDFVATVDRELPGVLLQWEDFALPNAHRLLDRYRDRLCTFNDDIQGTAAVALAALLSSGKASGTRPVDHRVVIVGAGTAGTGIADGIVADLIDEGLSEREAIARLWLVDRAGPLHDGMKELQGFQRRYARPMSELADWTRGDGGGVALAEVVERVRPTALIGTSGHSGTFPEDAVRAMARHVAQPAIFPLSNPTSRSEATPEEILAWTDGRALVATGSPFAPVRRGGRTIRISQCNNVYIFPGVGQGVLTAGARRVPDTVFLAAARVLADASPASRDRDLGLLPLLDDVVAVSRRIALGVIADAQRLGLAPTLDSAEWSRKMDARWWEPDYPAFRRR